jgi:hypothetical protein
MLWPAMPNDHQIIAKCQIPSHIVSCSPAFNGGPPGSYGWSYWKSWGSLKKNIYIRLSCSHQSVHKSIWKSWGIPNLWQFHIASLWLIVGSPLFFLTWTWAVTWDTRSLRSRFAPGIITSRIWNQLTNGVFKIFSWSSLIFKSRYAEIEESKLQEIDHLESWRILPTWIHLLSMLKPRF